MALSRTTTSISAGADVLASWGNLVYNDIGSVVNYRIVAIATDGATVTFDMNTAGIHEVTLGDNRTLAVSNVQDGQTFFIILKQDATGSRTVTWFSNILWPGNLPPVLTTTANKYDVFSFIRRGSNYLGNIVGQNY